MVQDSEQSLADKETDLLIRPNLDKLAEESQSPGPPLGVGGAPLLCPEARQPANESGVLG